MPMKIQLNSRFAQKLYEALIPELKRGVLAVDQWAFLGTLAGPVRPGNQDRLFAGQFTSQDGQTFRIVALSDGMGGLEHGQEAAALTLSSFLSSLVMGTQPLLIRLGKAAKYANEQVYDHFNGRSGATLSAVVRTPTGRVIGVNVGDSRIYSYNRELRILRQVSTDDTLAGIADQGASIDVRHNSGALLQHIGMGSDMDPNILDDPELSESDHVMLTTDGVHWVGNRMLELISQNASDGGQLTRRVMQLAEMTGAHDNATVGIMSLDQPFDDSLSMHTSQSDTEVWTPQSKTVFIFERYRAENREIHYEKNVYSDQKRNLENLEQNKKDVIAKKRPRRRTNNKNQPELIPAEKPEIIIDFDQPKRAEDETSR